MRIRTSQAGVGHILALLLVIVVIGAVSFAGYTVWKTGEDEKSATTGQADTSIETKADLEDASASLDSLEAGLDEDLDVSTLDSDIDQLL